MRHFLTADPVTGSGKTYSATNYAAVASKRRQRNSVFCMPSIKLITNEVKALKKRYPEIADRITVIHSESGDPVKVITRLTGYLRATKEDDGALLFITHEALLRLPYWHRRDHWSLYLDEVIETVYNERFKLKENRDLLLRHLDIRPYCPVSDGEPSIYSILVAKNQGKLEAWGANLKSDQVTAMFTNFASKMRQGSGWVTFVETEKYNRFVEGADDDETGYPFLDVHGRLSPQVFDGFRSVTLMAANLSKSLMHMNFKRSHCTFAEHTGIMRAIGEAGKSKEHTNGKRLKIFYFTKRAWSKSLRDLEVNGITLKQRFLDAIKLKFGDQPFLWIANNDVSDGALDGTRLNNRPHGRNEFQDFNACAVLSALNASRTHEKFLREVMGITPAQLCTARLGQLSYQALGRGSLRNEEATCDFVMIVPDLATALELHGMYPGSQMQMLTANDPAPALKTPGKKPRVPTSVHSSIRSTPYDQFTARGTHLDDDAVEGRSGRPDSSAESDEPDPVPGFRMSEWMHKKSERPWCDDKLLTTSEFYDYLQQMNHRSHISRKEKALMWSPSAFYERRTKLNCVLVRGIVLDMESGIRIEDIAGYLPDLEMIIHPSFNHSETDHRYRVMIPTTDDMTGQQSEMIRRSLMRKLEDAGFARVKDRLYRPTRADLAKPKHGVDVSKMNSAALFYLPCNEVDITHLAKDRAPLDPKAWVASVPEDIVRLVRVMYDEDVTPAAAEAEADNPPAPPIVSSDGPAASVRRIMGHFESIGGYRQGGRTPFWALSKMLRSTGMEIPTIQQALYEVAGSMHDPQERRDQIPELIRDIDKDPHQGRGHTDGTRFNSDYSRGAATCGDGGTAIQ